MAITELLFGAPFLTKIGLVQFDATISEVLTDTCEATKHAIEDGSTLSDHVHIGNAVYELQGKITNTPVMYLASIRSKSPVDGFTVPGLKSRVDDAYAALLDQKGKLITIYTKLRTYKNATMLSIAVRRDARTGNILDASMRFEELSIANALAANLPDPEDISHRAQANKGRTNGADASEAQIEATNNILNQLSGLFGA